MLNKFCDIRDKAALIPNLFTFNYVGKSFFYVHVDSMLMLIISIPAYYSKLLRVRKVTIFITRIVTSAKQPKLRLALQRLTRQMVIKTDYSNFLASASSKL